MNTEIEETKIVLKKYKYDIVWRNVIALLMLHVYSLYATYLIVCGEVKWQTVLFGCEFLPVFCAFGISAGAHRLWAHRCFKAKFPLRVFLAFLNTMCLQNHLYNWCRDHRAHHRYSDTDADPHNASRGFFFSHIGWLMVRKHPELTEKCQQIDMSDMWADPVVRFQKRFYIPLALLIWGVIPTAVPCYLWSESVANSFLVCSILRFLIVIHASWLVNSAAHLYGDRPYDSMINPRQNYLAILSSMGEGYHNYHHTFPWDYSASEYGPEHAFNLTTWFIDFCAKIGLAYDLRKPNDKSVSDKKNYSGDKSDTKKTYSVMYSFFCFGIMSNFHLIVAFLLRCFFLSLSKIF